MCCIPLRLSLSFRIRRATPISVVLLTLALQALLYWHRSISVSGLNAPTVVSKGRALAQGVKEHQEQDLIYYRDTPIGGHAGHRYEAEYTFEVYNYVHYTLVISHELPTAGPLVARPTPPRHGYVPDRLLDQ